MRANLYSIETVGAVLMDGNLTEYNNIYSNDVDIYDAWKMANPGINFGIMRSAVNLSVERRTTVEKNDTSFFRMWNMAQKNYYIKFMIKNMDNKGFHCFIQDNYLKTQTPIGLNDTTLYNFTVDANTASAAEMRFQLIYELDRVIPTDVEFTFLHAKRQGIDIMLQWEVTNERFINSYSVQHSSDGVNFSELAPATPSNTGTAAKTYDYTQLAVPKAIHYYRIKATRIDGEIKYSAVAKITESTAAPSMNVYPNPVVNRVVKIEFINIPAGTYYPVLVFNNGTLQHLSPVVITEAQANGSVNLPQSLAPGIYHLEFIGTGKTRFVKTIRVL